MSRRNTWVGLQLSLILVLGAACTTNSTTSVDVTAVESFNLDQVSQHAAVSDCWMVIDGSVYDVTDYVQQHPGGDRIVSGCGTDATPLFKGQVSSGRNHSTMAETLLQEYVIGTLSN